ncbi:MAG: hypothetical protein ACPGVO_00075 [Spirulinaceae cyanobacterium]
MKIPEYQRTPPAGHHDALAYRPACSQLKRRLVNDQTEWFVTLPDGSDYTLATIPPMPQAQSHASLDAAGYCKTGGEDVPIIAPEDAIATIGHRLELTPVMAQTPALPWLTIAGVIAIPTLIYGLYRARQGGESESW